MSCKRCIKKSSKKNNILTWESVFNLPMITVYSVSLTSRQRTVTLPETASSACGQIHEKPTTASQSPAVSQTLLVAGARTLGQKQTNNSHS